MAKRLRLLLGPFILRGRHGVHEEERQKSKEYVLRVTLDLKSTRACETDLLADTVDYEGVYGLLCDQMKQSSYLLEHVAERIGRSLMALSGVGSVRVEIEKPDVYAHAPEARAVIVWETP